MFSRSETSLNRLVRFPLLVGLCEPRARETKANCKAQQKKISPRISRLSPVRTQSLAIKRRWVDDRSIVLFRVAFNIVLRFFSLFKTYWEIFCENRKNNRRNSQKKVGQLTTPGIASVCRCRERVQFKSVWFLWGDLIRETLNWVIVIAQRCRFGNFHTSHCVYKTLTQDSVSVLSMRQLANFFLACLTRHSIITRKSLCWVQGRFPASVSIDLHSLLIAPTGFTYRDLFVLT